MNVFIGADAKCTFKHYDGFRAALVYGIADYRVGSTHTHAGDRVFARGVIGIDNARGASLDAKSLGLVVFKKDRAHTKIIT